MWLNEKTADEAFFHKINLNKNDSIRYDCSAPKWFHTETIFWHTFKFFLSKLTTVDSTWAKKTYTVYNL